ncbi:YggS family pyridoxal phosphate-dependent enzyme [Barrientosiimonas humi]|uniref:YggS family pyridoxal phosphate-dependent enzyme n=1 Tax=Barrientosiimonas humi TaxID=999931 RepID=UPI00370DA817
MTERRDELAANLQRVRERIDAACADAGRSPEELTLVVVTKFFPASDVALLADLGVTDVAENRHQEAGEKVASLDPDVRRRLAVHFVGQLQSNKAAAVTRYADVVQSVDRAKIARALDRAAGERDHPLEVTVQVDLSGDDAGRGGVRPADLPALVEEVAGLEHLRLRGLMAVAPLGADPAPAFDTLAELAESTRRDHPDATWMSAGMSGDLEQAIAAGATHLRVGSAILGSRPAQR